MNAETLKQFLLLIRAYVRFDADKILADVMRSGADMGKLFGELQAQFSPTEIALMSLLIQQEARVLPMWNIITVQRGESSGSKSPKWTMRSSKGETMWVFRHDDPQRNSIAVFEAAGWGGILNAMKSGTTLNFTKYPIQVEVDKDGSYWRPIRVLPKPADAQADEIANRPDPVKARDKAIERARIIAGGDFYVVDTETTGVGKNDEPVSVGIARYLYKTQEIGDDSVNYYTLVKPSVPISEGAMSIHGITEERVSIAPTLAQVIGDLWGVYLSKHFMTLAWNAEFDARMLKANNLGLEIECAMKLFAQFNGEWNDKRNEWQTKRLEDAMLMAGLSFEGDKHNALDDARATAQIILWMAKQRLSTEEPADDATEADGQANYTKAHGVLIGSAGEPAEVIIRRLRDSQDTANLLQGLAEMSQQDIHEITEMMLATDEPAFALDDEVEDAETGEVVGLIDRISTGSDGRTIYHVGKRMYGAQALRLASMSF